MSIADFNDIYRICCDWDSEDFLEAIFMVPLNQLPTEQLTYTKTSHLNRLGKIAEKELLTVV